MEKAVTRRGAMWRRRWRGGEGDDLEARGCQRERER